jgi:hypothetical protein
MINADFTFAPGDKNDRLVDVMHILGWGKLPTT